jgi:hypothetical protein
MVHGAVPGAVGRAGARAADDNKKVANGKPSTADGPGGAVGLLDVRVGGTSGGQLLRDTAKVESSCCRLRSRRRGRYDTDCTAGASASAASLSVSTQPRI